MPVDGRTGLRLVRRGAGLSRGRPPISKWARLCAFRAWNPCGEDPIRAEKIHSWELSLLTSTKRVMWPTVTPMSWDPKLEKCWAISETPSLQLPTAKGIADSIWQNFARRQSDVLKPLDCRRKSPNRYKNVSTGIATGNLRPVRFAPWVQVGKVSLENRDPLKLISSMERL